MMADGERRACARAAGLMVVLFAAAVLWAGLAWVLGPLGFLVLVIALAGLAVITAAFPRRWWG